MLISWDLYSITLANQKDFGLCRDDGLLLLHNVNGHQIHRVRKSVIQLSKDVGFLIGVKTNLKIVNFLDITFNLDNGSFKPYRKPSDSLLYIKGR